MSIQDFVFFGVSVAFCLALVPTLMSPTEKPPYSTSMFTGSLLLVDAVNEFSLSLYMGAALTAVGAVLWFVLAWQVAGRVNGNAE